MESIKLKPTSIKDYYLNFKDVYAKKIQSALLDKDRLESEIEVRRKSILPHLSIFKFPIIDYPEFQQNKYINGRFITAAIAISKDTRLTDDVKERAFELLALAKAQKQLHDTNILIAKSSKILELTYKEYRKILKTFYFEVQKQLVLNGNGYVFEGALGWISFIRYKVCAGRKKTINFMATSRRKKEILEQGGKLYNEEEAKWCEENGLPYDGIDYRIYLHDEYYYSLRLHECKLKNGSTYKLNCVDSRPVKYKGISNEDFVKEANGDVNKIMDKDLDVKTKLTLCLKCDETLYTKFITHED